MPLPPRQRGPPRCKKLFPPYPQGDFYFTPECCVLPPFRIAGGAFFFPPKTGPCLFRPQSWNLPCVCSPSLQGPRQLVQWSPPLWRTIDASSPDSIVHERCCPSVPYSRHSFSLLNGFVLHGPRSIQHPLLLPVFPSLKLLPTKARGSPLPGPSAGTF